MEVNTRYSDSSTLVVGPGMCKGREQPSIASEIKSDEGAIFSTSLREV